MQNNTFSTLFVGQNLIKLSEVDSTNNFLKMMASNSEPLPEGTVIMADKQYAGRGQQQNTWFSEEGKNLTFSVYLTPKFLPVNKQFFLNMAISNAVCKAIFCTLGAGTLNKWPNDIYFGQKKLGGVLIENIVAGSTIKASIIGIGINVNQQSFAPELETKATSIYQILQRDVNLIKLLGEICGQIEKEYLILRAGNYSSLMNVYIHNLYKFGALGRYRQNGQIIEGRITGVNDNGQLMLEVNGENLLYNFKEIEFLNN